MDAKLIPLLVITGATASGKSRLALALAQELDAEIVSADAVAVYRGLDIGSDKPSAADRQRVRHHLIDVAEPDQRFSAGDFTRLAHAAITAIHRAGRTPLLAGGSTFYLKALLDGLFPSPPRDAELGRRLHRAWNESPQLVLEQLHRVDPESARLIGRNDRQRVVRAIEFFELTGSPISEARKAHDRVARYRPLIVFPERSAQDLYAKIDERVDRMFATGLVNEVEGLLAAGIPGNAHALRSIGYRQVVGFLRNELDLAMAVTETKRASRRFAKRQLAWLRGFREGVSRPVPPAEKQGAVRIANLWRAHNRESRLS